MQAVCWFGKHDVRVENVDEPEIVNPRDAIVRVTSTAICGSDIHLYDGAIPTMQNGDILGHEFMGEVVELGSAVKTLKVGDRVVVPFPIACGRCWFCQRGDFALCDNSNPNAWMAEKHYGHSCAGIFGYSHMLGGYAGGQAEYVRVPFADVGPFKVEQGLPDEKVLFLTDIFPTGYQAAEYCNIQRGDTIAVWGCGPVGQFAIRSAFLLRAGRVFAIDDIPERLEMAEEGGAEPIDFDHETILEVLEEATGGMGPDACIDAVGLEAHGLSIGALYDRLKTTTYMATDRISVLRQAIQACRKSGTVSVPGVYAGYADKFPLGAAFGKGLTIRTGQTHVQRYMPKLMEHIEKGDIDPSFVITHRLPLARAREAYDTFHHKRDGCVKVVMTP